MSHVNAAIRKFLEQCSQSHDPSACLTELVAELRTTPGWLASEVDDVETTTRRILAGLTSPAQGDKTSELALWD